MRWCLPFLVLISVWAGSALGNILPNIPTNSAAVSYNKTSVNNLFRLHIFSERIEDKSDYKQLKYSKKLSRYLWLKDKKPKVLSYYNNLSRIVFFHILPPVNFFNKELFHVFPIEYDHKGNLRVLTQRVWTQNPPDTANRLGGWKESNILYKGSLTYHSISESII